MGPAGRAAPARAFADADRETSSGRHTEDRHARDRRPHAVLRDRRDRPQPPGQPRARRASCSARPSWPARTRSSCRSATTAALYTRAAYDKPYDNENSFGATYGEHREFLEFGARGVHASCRPTRKSWASTSSPPPSTSASADFLESLDVPAYKIASGDLKSTPLLKHVASLRQADDRLDRRRAARGRAARLRRDHADQPAAGHPAVHGRLSGGVRGARPARHRAPTASASRTRSSASRATTTASPCRWPPTCSARGSSRSTSR